MDEKIQPDEKLNEFHTAPYNIWLSSDFHPLLSQKCPCMVTLAMEFCLSNDLA